MQYDLVETKDFNKSFKKLSKEIKKSFENQLKQVKINPFSVGKPLKGRKWFRELKQGKYRLYYLIYDNEIIVLLIDVSNKKLQQETIDFIVEKFNEFKEFIKSEKI